MNDEYNIKLRDDTLQNCSKYTERLGKEKFGLVRRLKLLKSLLTNVNIELGAATRSSSRVPFEIAKRGYHLPMEK